MITRDTLKQGVAILCTVKDDGATDPIVHWQPCRWNRMAKCRRPRTRRRWEGRARPDRCGPASGHGDGVAGLHGERPTTAATTKRDAKFMAGRRIIEVPLSIIDTLIYGIYYTIKKYINYTLLLICHHHALHPHMHTRAHSRTFAAHRVDCRIRVLTES